MPSVGSKFALIFSIGLSAGIIFYVSFYQVWLLRNRSSNLVQIIDKQIYV